MESNYHVNAATQEVTQTGVGFDPEEPKISLIVVIGFATLCFLVLTVLGIQAYFDHVKAEQVHEQVEVPVAEDFKNLRTAEDEALGSYKYSDKDAGVVQIPVARAMELIAKEAEEGKLKYYAKTYAVKVPGAAAGTTDGAAAAPAAGSTPNGGASSTKPAK